MPQPGTTIYRIIVTHGVVDGFRVPRDADDTPTVTLYRNNRADATAVTVTKVSGVDGTYVLEIPIPGGWSDQDTLLIEGWAEMDEKEDRALLFAFDPATVDTVSRQDIASKTEIEMANDLTGEAFRQQLADLIAADWVAGDASPVAVASALVANASFAQLIADAAGVASTLGAMTSSNVFTAEALANVPLAPGAATADNVEDAQDTLGLAIAALNDLSAEEVRTELATELARIDVAVSSVSGGSGSGGPFLNTKVWECHTVDVGSRADGRTGNRVIRMAPGEKYALQWRYSRVIAQGDAIDAMALPTSDDTDIALVTGEGFYGVENEHAKVQVRIPSDASVGATTFIRADITPEGAEVDKAVMKIEVIDATAGL